VGIPTLVGNYWRLFTIIYVLLFSYTTYRIRRHGAPLSFMTGALVYNVALVSYYTFSWSQYQAVTQATPSSRLVFFLGFLPALIALPFFRRISHVKNDFREMAIERRKAIKKRDRAIGSVAASRLLYELIKQNVMPRDGYIAVYSAVASELSLESLVVNLARAGYKVAYPAIIGEGLMRFYTTVGVKELQLQSLDLVADPMGVKTTDELRGLKLVEPRRVSVIIVPGVAFDPDCCRMGFGGGFYDRYLPRLRETTRMFGVCFDEQIYKSLPVEPHDQRLDAVVTPTGVYHAKQ
jgi:5-formyltetrahydrofolate cyclo-ligase